MAMSDEFKNFLDWGAVGTSIGALANEFISFLPHAITFISSVLAMLWIFLRVMGELRKQGYIRERARKHTRKEDIDDDI